MTIRETVARWVYPEIFQSHHKTTELFMKHAEGQRYWDKQAKEARFALRNIIALRTPRSAHIGKRMAQIAEEALK